MTSGQHIDYDALALEALRGVVRACLAQVASSGLVGEHHFYIAFNTQAPGVGLSKRLKEKYPVEMTIVLQHRFWDLVVEADRFEVKLTFDGIPELLVVPFAAVKVFYDPSVPYILQFEEVQAQSDGSRRPQRPVGAPQAGSTMATGTANAGLEARDGDGRQEGSRPLRRGRGERSGSNGAATSTTTGAPPVPGQGRPALPSRRPEPVAPTPVASEPVAPEPAAPRPAAQKPSVAVVPKSDEAAGNGEEPSPASDGGGAKILDLSKFRGKK